MRSRICLALNGLLLGGMTLLAGCGESGPEVIPVSGRVTVNGQPVEKIRVEFRPVDVGDSSSGLTDADGRFTLKTLQEKLDGAVEGAHKVVLYDTNLVEKYIPARQLENSNVLQGRRSRIAAKYMDKMSTPLEVKVASNVQPFEFDVEANTAPASAPPSAAGPAAATVDLSDPRAVRAAEEAKQAKTGE